MRTRIRAHLVSFASIFAAAGLLLSAAPPASATTVLRVTMDDLTRTSQSIVRATVLEVQDMDLRAEGRGLFTDITLAVHAVYQGVEVPRRYVLRMVGGRGLDGVTLAIPGMPRFQRGEDVLLFLEKTSLGHIPTGLGQGVWRVTTTPSGAAFVRQDTGGVNLLERDARGQLQPAHGTDGHAAQVANVKLLDDLVADIYASQARTQVAPTTPVPAVVPAPAVAPRTVAP